MDLRDVKPANSVTSGPQGYACPYRPSCIKQEISKELLLSMAHTVIMVTSSSSLLFFLSSMWQVKILSLLASKRMGTEPTILVPCVFSYVSPYNTNIFLNVTRQRGKGGGGYGGLFR
jgi:hypothetical protein